MKEIKFTPGPWIWGDDYQGLYGAGPNNQVLDYFAGEGMALGYNKHMDANARLLAAAPAMYEALEELCRYADDSNDCQYGTLSTRLVKDIAETALAKARGEK
jgi:hypothetical protein